MTDVRNLVEKQEQKNFEKFRHELFPEFVWLVDAIIEEIRANKDEMARYLRQYPRFFERVDRYFNTLWTSPDLVRTEPSHIDLNRKIFASHFSNFLI